MLHLKASKLLFVLAGLTVITTRSLIQRQADYINSCSLSKRRAIVKERAPLPPVELQGSCKSWPPPVDSLSNLQVHIKKQTRWAEIYDSLRTPPTNCIPILLIEAHLIWIDGLCSSVWLTHRRSVAVVFLGVYGIFHGLKNSIICGQVSKHSGITWKVNINLKRWVVLSELLDKERVNVRQSAHQMFRHVFIQNYWANVSKL